MKPPNLLQDIYEEWLEKDDSHMEDFRQIIADFKSYMIIELWGLNVQTQVESKKTSTD